MLNDHPLPVSENIYETPCPILYAMRLIGQKWKLPILWYLAAADACTLRLRKSIAGPRHRCILPPRWHASFS